MTCLQIHHVWKSIRSCFLHIMQRCRQLLITKRQNKTQIWFRTRLKLWSTVKLKTRSQVATRKTFHSIPSLAELDITLTTRVWQCDLRNSHVKRIKTMHANYFGHLVEMPDLPNSRDGWRSSLCLGGFLTFRLWLFIFQRVLSSFKWRHD